MMPRTESPKIREPMVRMMPYMIDVCSGFPASIPVLYPSAAIPVTIEYRLSPDGPVRWEW